MEAACCLQTACQAEAAGNEALHQEAIGWFDVGFKQIDAGAGKLVTRLEQRTLALAIAGQYRLAGKVLQFGWFLAPEVTTPHQGRDLLAVSLGNKAHCFLAPDAPAQGAVIRCQPESQLQTGIGLLPLARENKSAAVCVSSYCCGHCAARDLTARLCPRKSANQCAVCAGSDRILPSSSRAPASLLPPPAHYH